MAVACGDDADGLHLPEFQRRFANRLRSRRKRHGLRQRDLEDFGLSWTSVQTLEYGITDPKISTLLKLCQAFDLTPPGSYYASVRRVLAGRWSLDGTLT